MWRIGLLAIALLSMPSRTSAQTCAGYDAEITATSSQGETGSWTTAFRTAKSGLTTDFYVKAFSTIVNQQALINLAADDTDAIAGVRVDAGTWWALENTVNEAPSWVDTGESVTTSDWTHVEFDMEAMDGCYKVRFAVCDGAWSSWYPASGEYGRCHPGFSAQEITVARIGIKNPDSVSAFELDTDLAMWTLDTIAPNCSGDASFCGGPFSCDDRAKTYTACAAEPYSPFCDGQSETWAYLEPSLLDQLRDWWTPTAHAVAGGRTPLDDYSTARATLCSSVVIGPNTLYTASHCHQSNTETDWTVEADDITLTIEHNPGTTYHVRRVELFDRGNPVASGYTDQAVLYTSETLPGPYADELYDYASAGERANCTAIISQGFGTECSYAVLYEHASPSDGDYRGWCVDPWHAKQVGGDSGGPLYAIGDWDGAGGGAPYPKLYGVQSGGEPWNRYNNIQKNAATEAFWDNNRLAPSVDLLAISEIVFEDVEFDWDADADITAADVALTCRITARTTGTAIAAAGCEMHTGSGSPMLSCSDNAPVGNLYECLITLPQDSSANWEVSSAFVTTTTGDIRRASQTVLAQQGIKRMVLDVGLPPTASIPQPSIKEHQPHVAPGGELFCSFNSGATATTTAYSGCIYNFSDGSQLVSSQGQGIVTSNFEASGTVDPGTAAGVTYDTVVYSVSSKNPRSGVDVVTAQGTVFDCATVGQDETYTGAGTMTSIPVTQVGGQYTAYEAYLRVSADDQNATYLIGEGAITSEANATMGVRFSSSGVVQVLDGGVWSAENVFNYSVDTWYRVRIEASSVTIPQGGLSPMYTLKVATCGGGFTTITTDAVYGNGARYYTGTQEWTLGSAAASQKIDLIHNDWAERVFCFPTSCVIEEPDWNCGTPPDGCGTTLASCGTCGGGTPTCNTETYLCEAGGAPGAVLSVQHLAVTLADGVSLVDTVLNGQVLDNSIPFITTRVTTPADPDAMMADYAATAWFFDATTLRVERGTANVGGGQLVVEVTVVEFDPTRVDVQSGAYDLAFGSTITAIPSPALTVANTFLYHSWWGFGNNSAYDNYLVQGSVTSPSLLTFNIDGGSIQAAGHWFTADATAGGDFTVQQVDISLADTESSGTGALTTVDMDKTFLLGSYKGLQFTGSGANSAGTVEVHLSSATQIDLQRSGTTANIDWTGFAVEMADATTVLRGTRVQASALSPDSFAPGGTFVEAESMIHSAGNAGSLAAGSFTGTAIEDVPDAFCAWDFDGTNVRVTKFIGGGEFPNDLSWEVIDWDVQ